MSYLTLKNDRIRRRRARLLTFIITTAVLGGAAYGMGATQELGEMLQQLFGTPVATDPVASLT